LTEADAALPPARSSAPVLDEEDQQQDREEVFPEHFDRSDRPQPTGISTRYRVL
jgi:hypothetical protein